MTGLGWKAGLCSTARLPVSGVKTSGPATEEFILLRM